MKLIYCPECHDIKKLSAEWTECECGDSYGWYCEGDYHAKIGGNAIPIGISNPSFVNALQDRPEEGLGGRFEAFVIPEKWPTIEVVN